MKWNHLPWPGGLYDQHPQLLEEFRYIFEQRNLQREKEQKAREAESKRSSHGVAGGRRR